MRRRLAWTRDFPSMQPHTLPCEPHPVVHGRGEIRLPSRHRRRRPRVSVSHIPLRIGDPTVKIGMLQREFFLNSIIPRRCRVPFLSSGNKRPANQTTATPIPRKLLGQVDFHAQLTRPTIVLPLIEHHLRLRWWLAPQQTARTHQPRQTRHDPPNPGAIQKSETRIRAATHEMPGTKPEAT